MIKGEIDIVRGDKGAGKSAIYSLLITRESEFFDRNTLLVPGEKPRGTVALQYSKTSLRIRRPRRLSSSGFGSFTP
jgi:hypothetical protein